MLAAEMKGKRNNMIQVGKRGMGRGTANTVFAAIRAIRAAKMRVKLQRYNVAVLNVAMHLPLLHPPETVERRCGQPNGLLTLCKIHYRIPSDETPLSPMESVLWT